MDLPLELPDIPMGPDSPDDIPLHLPEIPHLGHCECLAMIHKPLARGLARWLCSANDTLVSTTHDGCEHWMVVLDDIFGRQESFAKYLAIRRLLVISDLVSPAHPSLNFIGWGAEEWAGKLAAPWPWQKKTESSPAFIALLVKAGTHSRLNLENGIPSNSFVPAKVKWNLGESLR